MSHKFDFLNAFNKPHIYKYFMSRQLSQSVEFDISRFQTHKYLYVCVHYILFIYLLFCFKVGNALLERW